MAIFYPCKSGSRPFHILMQQQKCEENFGSADWVFKMPLTCWYSVVAESDSRPSSAYILSLLAPWIAPVITKHALDCTLSSFDSKFTLPGLSYVVYLHNKNVDERTFCI